MYFSPLIVVALLGLAAGANYDGYKVYSALPKTLHQLESLAKFKGDRSIDFWSQPRRIGSNVTIMVPPKLQKSFQKYLTKHSILHTVIIKDVEKNIKKTLVKRSKKSRVPAGEVTFDEYLRHDEINAYLEKLAENNPDTVKVQTIGKSYEGRELKTIRIYKGEGESKAKIFVDAGIHAREWIAPATALYIIQQLVEVEDNVELSTNVEWIILPSVNPDGYEYSYEEDRLWRKTRSEGDFCDGVDANRNFDFHWAESGASDFECDEIYAGPTAFSEPETQTLRDALLAEENVQLYLTLHSYGQYILYPWGFDSSLPDNWEELDTVGNTAADAIKAIRGTKYSVGSSTLLLYAAAGASDDYAKGVANIPLSYTIELPGGGYYGFDLPESEIKDVVVETFEGIKAFQKYVEENSAKNLKKH